MDGEITNEEYLAAVKRDVHETLRRSEEDVIGTESEIHDLGLVAFIIFAFAMFFAAGFLMGWYIG